MCGHKVDSCVTTAAAGIPTRFIAPTHNGALAALGEDCERATGIGPAYVAWEATALPLSYARMGRMRPRIEDSGGETFASAWSLQRFRTMVRMVFGRMIHLNAPKPSKARMSGADGRDRTHVFSLEGWRSSIELHPHETNAPQGTEDSRNALVFSCAAFR